MALADEAVEHANRSGDALAVSEALVSRVQGTGDFATAARHAPAAIRHLRSVGDLEQTAVVCSDVGAWAIMGAEYEEALRWLDQGLTAANESGDPSMRCFIRGNQGLASVLLGELADAELALDEALELCHEAGDEAIVAETLLAAAALAAEGADLPRAARLASAAERHQGRPAGSRANRWCGTGYRPVSKGHGRAPIPTSGNALNVRARSWMRRQPSPWRGRD